MMFSERINTKKFYSTQILDANEYQYSVYKCSLNYSRNSVDVRQPSYRPSSLDFSRFSLPPCQLDFRVKSLRSGRSSYLSCEARSNRGSRCWPRPRLGIPRRETNRICCSSCPRRSGCQGIGRHPWGERALRRLWKQPRKTRGYFLSRDLGHMYLHR